MKLGSPASWKGSNLNRILFLDENGHHGHWPLPKWNDPPSNPYKNGPIYKKRWICLMDFVGGWFLIPFTMRSSMIMATTYPSPWAKPIKLSGCRFFSIFPNTYIILPDTYIRIHGCLVCIYIYIYLHEGLMFMGNAGKYIFIYIHQPHGSYSYRIYINIHKLDKCLYPSWN